jgi:hypothetical protein
MPKNLQPTYEDFCSELRRLKGLYNLSSIGNLDEVYLNLGLGSGVCPSIRFRYMNHARLNLRIIGL